MPDEHPIFEFARFRLDPLERLLLRDGRPVPITPKAFDLLVYLVERQGRLVEKQAILSDVWPDAIVEEANLAYNVSALRKVLDESASGESMIQTVPTRGYRFVAPVHRIPRPDDQGAAPHSVVTASPVHIRRRLLATSVGIGLVVLLAVWGLAIRRARQQGGEPTALPEPELTQLTANAADRPLNSARISPDGKYLAYSDPTGIQIQVIDTGETHSLADTAGMSVYAWSSDSTKVYASRCNAGTCVGWSIGIFGESRIQTGATWPETDVMRSAPDGSRIARVALWSEVKVDLLNGMPPRTIASGQDIYDVNWSADGARVFVIMVTQNDSNAVYSYPVQGGSPTRVIATGPGEVVQDVVELPAHRLLLKMHRDAPKIERSGGEEWSIVELGTDQDGRAVGPRRSLWSSHREDIEYLSTSSEGRRLAFLATGGAQHSYIADFDPVSGIAGSARRLTLDDWEDLVSSWASDNRTVFFESNRYAGGRTLGGDIFRQRIDGGTPEMIAGGPGEQFRPEAASDGRWILFNSNLGSTTTRVMRMPLPIGSAEPLATLSGGGIPRCSLHGRCVLEEFQREDLVFSALDPVTGKGAELARVPWSQGGAGACILPDGNSVAVLTAAASGSGQRIRIVSLTGQPERDIAVAYAMTLENVDPVGGGAGGFLSVDNSYYSRPRHLNQAHLVFIAPDGSVRVLWSPPDVKPDWAISSPDGKHLAIVASSRQSNAWMLSMSSPGTH